MKKIFTSDNVDIQSNPDFGENCLHFVFKGKFTASASIAACEVWTKEFERSVDQGKFVLIWDCLSMDGFEVSAKKQWQEHMNIYHDRISEVIVVSNNILIRGAARLILKIFDLKSTVVRSFEELK